MPFSWRPLDDSLLAPVRQPDDIGCRAVRHCMAIGDDAGVEPVAGEDNVGGVPHTQEMRAEDLLGEWSSDALSYPGAQSDWSLFLRGDGLGSLAYGTATSTSASIFTWSLADDALTTRTLGNYAESERGGWETLEASSGWDQEANPVSLSVEDTPARPAMRVLRLVSRVEAALPRPIAFARVGDEPRFGVGHLVPAVRISS
jgi:hypothetical protein